jgi:YbgC/YbaW family acyl-CoA thioester hydrolase
MPQASVHVRVPFHDVDSSKRIHFTAMLRYMELAEHELMRSIGFPYAAPLLNVAFPRVHISCDFCRAIRYDDELVVTARVEHVGRSSWTVAFTARFAQEEKAAIQGDVAGTGGAAAQGRMTIVAMDPQTEHARPLPEELRYALAAE